VEYIEFQAIWHYLWWYICSALWRWNMECQSRSTRSLSIQKSFYW